MAVEVVREIARHAKTETGSPLGGIFPPNFDPKLGIVRGEVTPDDGTLVERIDGWLYSLELLSIARAEHPGITWQSLVEPNSGANALYGCVEQTLVAVLMPRRP